MKTLTYLSPLLIIFLLLSACSQESEEKSQATTKESTEVNQKAVTKTPDLKVGTQKYYFLQSQQLVEQAGGELKNDNLSQAKIDAALRVMDKGLKLAFQVENEFLNGLDPRLGKNYQRYFVKGVETYRLGIEAGARSEQKEGMRLLDQWAQFWSAERATISAKFPPD